MFLHKNVWANSFLYVTVFFTGATVLVIEIVAVKILSTYFGNSLYVLSSVVSSILAALAMGYFFGGRIADRYPDARVLYFLLSLAALILLGVSVAHSFLFSPLAENSSMLYGPVLLSGFFILPAIILGADSPYVIKLLSSHHAYARATGTIAGNTFFLSTIGSILGSILTGFIFIPYFGITSTLHGAIWVLLAFSALGYALFTSLATDSKRTLSYIMLVCVSATLLASLIRIQSYNTSDNVLLETDTRNFHITITEEPTRHGMTHALRLDSSYASSIFTAPSMRQYHPYLYTQYSSLYQDLLPNASRFLLLGGGGYTIPRHILNSDNTIEIDVVEPDETLKEIAHTYLDLPYSDRLRNFHGDGRVFIHDKPSDTYDVIFSNAVHTGLSIPAHLITREYFEEIKRTLTTEGIFIINVIGSIRPDSPSVLGSVLYTIEQTFPSVKLYKVQDTPLLEIDNFIIVASQQDLSDAFVDTQIHDQHLQYHPVEQRSVALPYKNMTGEVILTDDKNSLIDTLILQEYKNFR